MICHLPEPIIVSIKSYLEIWEKFAISKNFVSKIQDHLEWPRDINRYANSSISYYSSVRLPHNLKINQVIDLYLHYQYVKNSYIFNFVFKESTAIMTIHYKCPNIQSIMDVIWLTKPFPITINVFNNFIHLHYTLKNCIGYNLELDSIGKAQLLNHWIEIVKKITATK
jgi:hypothetical protein